MGVAPQGSATGESNILPATLVRPRSSQSSQDCRSKVLLALLNIVQSPGTGLGHETRGWNQSWPHEGMECHVGVVMAQCQRTPHHPRADISEVITAL